MIRDVYGKHALSERVCQKWFAKLCSGDFNVKRASRSGRPSVEIDSDKIKRLIDVNHRYVTRDAAGILNVSKSSVENHLKALAIRE